MKIKISTVTSVYFNRQEINEILRTEAERRVDKLPQQTDILFESPGSDVDAVSGVLIIFTEAGKEK